MPKALEILTIQHLNQNEIANFFKSIRDTPEYIITNLNELLKRLDNIFAGIYMIKSKDSNLRLEKIKNINNQPTYYNSIHEAIIKLPNPKRVVLYPLEIMGLCHHHNNQRLLKPNAKIYILDENKEKIIAFDQKDYSLLDNLSIN